MLALLRQAGHRDFRDARGPMGFNQRQAAGKFTRDEAAALIDRLQEAGPAPPPGEGAEGAAAAVSPGAPRSAAEQALRRLPAEQLAAELRRRGWTVDRP
jgi:hypothetical protein